MDAHPPTLDYARPAGLLRRRWFQRFLIGCALVLSAGLGWARWHRVEPAPALVPLRLQYRGMVFDGGWTNFNPGDYPNLDPAEANPNVPPRPPKMLVPAGYVNLALNRPVTSSDGIPIIGDVKLITDGDVNGFDGNWVEFFPGLQWVQIDLGATKKLYAIAIWRDIGDPPPYRDVIVRVSDDPAFKRNVTTLFNNDRDNSAGMGAGTDYEYIEFDEWPKLINARGARARYVRCYSNGNGRDRQNRYAEVEVFGAP